MPTLILCANSLCQRKNTCRRFTDDPLNLIHKNRKARIDANLHSVDEIECSKYLAAQVTLTLIKTK